MKWRVVFWGSFPTKIITHTIHSVFISISAVIHTRTIDGLGIFERVYESFYSRTLVLYDVIQRVIILTERSCADLLAYFSSYFRGKILVYSLCLQCNYWSCRPCQLGKRTDLFR